MDIQIVLSPLGEMGRFRTRDQWTRKLLEAHQANALRLVREYAYAHSPFYQQFHKGLYDAPLQDLPVLTKATMMEHFDELVTDRAIRLDEVKTHIMDLSGDERYLGRNRVNATSGSAGRPGVFLFNRAEWTTVIASFARARAWAAIKVDLTRRVKTATVASNASFHISSRVNATVHPLVFSRVMDTLPVSGWQVVQEVDGLHVLLSGVRGEFEDAMLVETLRQALLEQEAIVPHLEAQRVASIPKSFAGKAPLIKSNLPYSSPLSGIAGSGRSAKEAGVQMGEH